MSEESSEDSDIEDTFTILVVDDNYEAVEDEVLEVLPLLKEKNLQAKILKAKTREEVVENLSNDVVDIIATDMNIQSHFTGKDVINEAKSAGYLTDVLFYSAQEIDYGDVLESTDFYGEIQFNKGIIIGAPLKRMVEKNIKRMQDIVYLRGVFISKVIDIELDLNDLFAAQFKVPVSSLKRFHELILENRGNTLEGKLEVLRHLIKDAKLEGFSSMVKDLGDLQHYRNYLAHCKRHSEKKDCLVSMGDEKSLNRAKVASLVKKSRKVSRKLVTLRSQLGLPLKGENSAPQPLPAASK